MSEIFRPVGNTDEASSSLGASGRMWSPFSPFFNQHQAVRTDLHEERGRHRVNPLTAKDKAALVSTSPAIVPVAANLALGGLIVNRDWAGAADYCDYLLRHYRAKSTEVYAEMAAKAKARAKGLKLKYRPKIRSESAVTWGVIFTSIGEYCRALAAGHEPIRPARTKSERNAGATVSLWTDVRRSSLAKEGNVKLPFAAYSEMPVVTCPGAGGVSKFAGLSGLALGAAVLSGSDVRGCASFCYSLKAFGKPSCVARQLVLTLGAAVDPVRHAGIVSEEMAKLAKRGVRIMRLFVDGDFRDAASIESWMDHCVRPLGRLGVTVYGYSKSWEQLWEVHQRKGAGWWPSNYVLNISSGSRFHDSAGWQARIRGLPISRGGFLAVDPLQRLLWKALTKARGEVVWQKYCNAVSRRAGVPRAAERLLNAVKHMVVKANPDLAAAYNDYINTIHEIENSPGVLARVAKIAGEKALKPGPVVQASTWAYLTELKAGREMPCPISCGTCPKTAIINHSKVVEAALLPELEKLAKEISSTEKASRTAYRAAITERAAKGSPFMHWCGNKKMNLDIIIGIH